MRSCRMQSPIVSRSWHGFWTLLCQNLLRQPLQHTTTAKTTLLLERSTTTAVSTAATAAATRTTTTAAAAATMGFAAVIKKVLSWCGCGGGEEEGERSPLIQDEDEGMSVQPFRRYQLDMLMEVEQSRTRRHHQRVSPPIQRAMSSLAHPRKEDLSDGSALAASDMSETVMLIVL